MMRLPIGVDRDCSTGLLVTDYWTEAMPLRGTEARCRWVKYSFFVIAGERVGVMGGRKRALTTWTFTHFKQLVIYRKNRNILLSHKWMPGVDTASLSEVKKKKVFRIFIPLVSFKLDCASGFNTEVCLVYKHIRKVWN